MVTCQRYLRIDMQIIENDVYYMVFFYDVQPMWGMPLMAVSHKQ
jgi:hypothetical protein